MELLRAADALLRTNGPPLFSLTPSTATRWIPMLQLSCNVSRNSLTRRAFGTTASQNAIKYNPTTTSTPPAEDQSSTSSSTPSSKSWLSPSRDPTAREQIEKQFNGGSTNDEILSQLNAARFSLTGSGSGSGIDTSRMLSPTPPSSLTTPANPSISSILSSISPPKRRKVALNLNPSLGREVAIGPSLDISRGIRLLEQSCARNKVRADSTRQRFHERGGLKRKRLRRERWRRRFMEGFKGTVGRVKGLRNQGW